MVVTERMYFITRANLDEIPAGKKIRSVDGQLNVAAFAQVSHVVGQVRSPDHEYRRPLRAVNCNRNDSFCDLPRAREPHPDRYVVPGANGAANSLVASKHIDRGKSQLARS